jgi:hypothetical protein
MLDEVKKYVARRPFEPFVIHTGDGMLRPVPGLDHILGVGISPFWTLKD